MSRPLRDLPARADLLIPALAAALDGAGPAVGVGVGDEPVEVPDDVALVVRTSGSTGEPRRVLLSASALRASAQATADRLDGPGSWLLALPTQHIAGLQVLVRSVLAGTEPVVVPDGPFRPPRFVQAVATMAAGPRYTSLVPTQLARLLDDAEGTDALRTFDAVLVGGAATGPELLDRARLARVVVVTTYGMSETCGGCVYDGVPLDGVSVRIGDDGRIMLAGPVLATGYTTGAEDSFVHLEGTRWLRTSDLGSWDGTRLTVLGRSDDVLVSGGTKVSPQAVEAVLEPLGEVVVVGIADDEWGQVVVALVVPRPGTVPTLEQARAAVTDRLGAAHAPRHLVVTGSLPLRGPGKIDRRAATQLADDLLARANPTGRNDT
ncbi:o-succinylbenzoate--CoA ligase [Cellulomonas sp. URHD0024]|uniref:o-succinylbenzoate--CoA ligase n=1 Tax=Cellulomonas sp. URHD0024 TaxID=1302620 RepID=UPI0003F869E9|nr:o-succinylbenzoate--CoA ligase [Cellulomonas sp. URHD0024]